jgi:hypothetical protein
MHAEAVIDAHGRLAFDSEIVAVVPDIAGERLSELNNCLADTSLDFLKRLHDGAPVWEQYRDGGGLHSHYMASGHPKCLRWRRRDFTPLEVLLHPP